MFVVNSMVIVGDSVLVGCWVTYRHRGIVLWSTIWSLLLVVFDLILLNIRKCAYRYIFFVI